MMTDSKVTQTIYLKTAHQPDVKGIFNTTSAAEAFELMKDPKNEINFILLDCFEEGGPNDGKFTFLLDVLDLVESDDSFVAPSIVVSCGDKEVTELTDREENCLTIMKMLIGDIRQAQKNKIENSVKVPQRT